MMKWLLAGTAAISMTAAAAEPENRTFHSGAFEVTAIQDAPSTMRAGLFPAIPETEFCKLAGAPLAPASVNVFLLKRDGKSILVDTGNGGERGTAIRKLRQLGIAPEMIDVILLTHMHGDHIGGLLNAAGGAAFPTAIVYVAEPERDYWLSEEAGSGGALAGKVRTAYGNRLKTFRFGEEPVPGIKALDASGHTPGHTVFDTGDLLIVGDLLHAAAIQFPHPEVSATYDMDPEKAARARRHFYDQAAASAKPVAGMHLPCPGVGRIHREAARYVYAPEP